MVAKVCGASAPMVTTWWPRCMTTICLSSDWMVLWMRMALKGGTRRSRRESMTSAGVCTSGRAVFTWSRNSMWVERRLQRGAGIGQRIALRRSAATSLTALSKKGNGPDPGQRRAGWKIVGMKTGEFVVTSPR